MVPMVPDTAGSRDRIRRPARGACPVAQLRPDQIGGRRKGVELDSSPYPNLRLFVAVCVWEALFLGVT